MRLLNELNNRFTTRSQLVVLAGLIVLIIITFVNVRSSGDDIADEGPSNGEFAIESQKEKPQTQEEKNDTKIENQEKTIYPSSVLSLKNWNLTIPLDKNGAKSGEAKIIKTLDSFSNEYFYANKTKNGVVFRTPVDGATTENSKYPRSELRELDSFDDKASWSSNNGDHTMTIKQAITKLPDAKPEIVAGQIHDSDDDVIMVRLENNRLFIEGDGEDLGTLDKNYRIGTVFTVRINVKNDRIKVLYNNKQKVDYRKTGSGFYFKAGCYVQSNLSKGEKKDSYGEVIIYALEVTHK